MITSGKIYSHLADIEEQAQKLFEHIITNLAAKEGINEQHKTTDTNEVGVEDE